MKNIIIIVIVLVIVGFGLYFLIPKSPSKVDTYQNQSIATSTNQTVVTSTPIVDTTPVIGKSVAGRDIIAYHYGTGETEILFIGGIHGGYEWNTTLLAYEAMDYLEANPNVIPTNLKITIIPVLNPDGLNKVVGTSGRFDLTDVSTSQTTVIAGRFNSNEVDLNRNFDCDWEPTGIWQNKTVSGGSQVFSEPESQAIKNYVTSHKPQAVVVWYSAAGGVYSSSCHNGILPETKTLTSIYAKASGYTSYSEFDSYEITGDMVNWLAKEKIPAISVLLTDHNNTEWVKNQAGIEAILNHLNHYAQ
ncbi:hypothetical protein COU49_00830 [Candidatus Nomurabacteria bacterium CG10_big_fil_rev_8_21_14_0_10_35_16]|uniref:Peptidase M14 domain-containing protein n=1 Tax=Candidatus Nomurabacteria bacterium CG10_big_fil_rev_8_21_14_0_10_35_16 TaxID=1974731 RepID=A0A2H0TBR6_9BACT|nr:MAG: hypothetical protein COU49_00830 [Candidatus Nomurabacteria bacterium CG10_big_fil_rev_8_21_14_0_10_35_16]